MQKLRPCYPKPLPAKNIFEVVLIRFRKTEHALIVLNFFCHYSKKYLSLLTMKMHLFLLLFHKPIEAHPFFGNEAAMKTQVLKLGFPLDLKDCCKEDDRLLIVKNNLLKKRIKIAQQCIFSYRQFFNLKSANKIIN